MRCCKSTLGTLFGTLFGWLVMFAAGVYSGQIESDEIVPLTLLGIGTLVAMLAAGSRRSCCRG